MRILSFFRWELRCVILIYITLKLDICNSQKWIKAGFSEKTICHYTLRVVIVDNVDVLVRLSSRSFIINLNGKSRSIAHFESPIVTGFRIINIRYQVSSILMMHTGHHMYSQISKDTMATNTNQTIARIGRV